MGSETGILYLPSCPSCSTVAAAAIKPGDVDSSGRLRDVAGVPLVCIPPALAALGWLAFFLFRMP